MVCSTARHSRLPPGLLGEPLGGLAQSLVSPRGNRRYRLTLERALRALSGEQKTDMSAAQNFSTTSTSAEKPASAAIRKGLCKAFAALIISSALKLTGLLGHGEILCYDKSHSRSPWVHQGSIQDHRNMRQGSYDTIAERAALNGLLRHLCLPTQEVGPRRWKALKWNGYPCGFVEISLTRCGLTSPWCIHAAISSPFAVPPSVCNSEVRSLDCLLF